MKTMIRATCGLALTLLCTAPWAGVECTVEYGGARSPLHAEPTTQPYEVQPRDFGTYFQMRIVYRREPADLAGIRVYVYGTKGDVPVLIHQGRWPLPGDGRRPVPGFTGLQRVYEPLRGTELEYQCDYSPEARP